MRSLIVVLVCAFLSVGTAFAQNQKIGHLNSDEILVLMPEAKKIDDSLKTVQAGMQEQVALLQAELQQMAAAFEDEKATLDAAMQKFRYDEIISKKDRIEEYVQVSQNSLLQLEADLMEPLRKKVVDAINKVAEEHKFSYLIDTASGAVLYVEGGIDAGKYVKEELGIDPNAKPPGAPGTGGTAAGGE